MRGNKRHVQVTVLLFLDVVFFVLLHEHHTKIKHSSTCCFLYKIMVFGELFKFSCFFQLCHARRRRLTNKYRGVSWSIVEYRDNRVVSCSIVEPVSWSIVKYRGVSWRIVDNREAVTVVKSDRVFQLLKEPYVLLLGLNAFVDLLIEIYTF